ncbi:MAG: exodeoxyribonuclease V subunit gamma, partial [Salinivirgaceae bacterium]
MAEQFYISNTIEKLSEKFAQNGQRKSDIFQKDTIITQTKGMNMWLAAELASKNNVFANFSFISPQNFINKLFKICEVATNYDYAAGKLTWEIYSLLNEPEFMDKFGFVANYYQNDDVKRFQLAAKIADLFDQYMIYRSSIIEHWNQQQHPELDNKEFQSDFKKHEQWQFWLWQKIKQLNAEDSPDQVELLESLIQKLRNGDYNSQIKQEFPSISFFGVTVLTAFHHKVFQILHSIIDVNYYLASPSAKSNWWQPDFRDRNDILANCKATGQYTFDTLLKNASADAITFDVNGTANKTLLNALQLDIAQNSTENIQKLDFDPIKDHSLQIASTYSPVREVEALYNYLLDLLDRDKQLTVKDISVQLTDVELYAPYIKAVFDNGPKEIPYTICDAAYTDGDTITNALESFFRIEIENFSNESVMRLLESKYVQRKFDLNDPDTIRHLLNDA